MRRENTMQDGAQVLHLRNGGTSLVLDLSAAGMPAFVHWGADLGDLSDSELAGLVSASLVQRVSGGLDHPARLSILPSEAYGWQGSPGLVGSRAGRDFSPAFVTTAVETDAASVVVSGLDPAAGLELNAELSLDGSGTLLQRLRVRNAGEDDYELERLSATLPLPSSAREILDTSGRHLRERMPQRHPFVMGSHVRESRKGRPGADSTLFLTVGTPGFGFERGLVHGAHLAWSGNHRMLVERQVTGAAILQGGELLAPGEVRLKPGESYLSPPLIASWGDGLNAFTARLHAHVRARPSHPRSPRPVTLNTWEAVYFAHDLDGLRDLASVGARVGVERFVLDDGWFRGRRDDRAGLGDWFVDEAIWPHGLDPLIEHVHGLDMQFGLWVEPEMVNDDSDLARAHPEWVLQTGDRMPIEGRQQQVLDLSHAGAYAYVRERMLALLADHSIDYLKWDHNRDLIDAGSTITGRAAVHDNVEALYRLLDDLKAAHPGLEIESCASGGARVDLGILAHTDRIWTSDCIDPLERLPIQKYTGVVVPYELMGAHVGGTVSHSTGRTSTLPLRSATALFGHFGIESDLRTFSEPELDALAAWVGYHQRHRAMFHTGTAVHAELDDDTGDLRGVVAEDLSRAVFVFTQVRSSDTYPPAPLRFPGLDDDIVYRVGIPVEPASDPIAGQSALEWAQSGVELSGRVLRTVGVAAPVLFPQHCIVIEMAAID
ncbi:alpha-galactosidase [Glaciibacter flavus]